MTPFIPLSRRRFLQGLAAAGLMTGTAPLWAQTTSSLPHERDLAPYGLTRAWWGQAVLDPSFDEVLYFTADEDNVYVQSRAGIMTAFQAETGKRLWSVLVGATNRISLPVSTNETEALVTIGLDLYAIDKFTGEVKWELQLPHHPSTSPEVDPRVVYLGMVDGSVYAYDLQMIQQLHEENRLPRWSNYAFLWRYKAPLQISSPPISNGRTVTFASQSGSVYAVGGQEHELLFQFETDAEIRAPIGIGGDSLFVVSEDARLYCLNADNGQRRWAFTAGVPIRIQPRIIGGNVYVAPQNNGLHCLNAVSGIIKWRQPRGTEFLASTDRLVFASDALGGILLLAHEDGAVVGTLGQRDLSVRMANDRTDRLYLASPDGLVVCIREEGRDFPLYHKYPDRRPILPELAPDEPAEEAPPAAN
jgi:outer membrane protein assembly factor BamB